MNRPLPTHKKKDSPLRARQLNALRSYRLLVWLGFVVACVWLCSTPCLGQDNTPTIKVEPNIEAADCPPLTAFPQLAGTVVVSCTRGDSTGVTMPLAPDAHGSPREKSVRGSYEYREYQMTHTEQAEHAFDDLLRLVPIGGFILKYSSNPSTITARNGDTWALINIDGDFYNISVVRDVPESWTPVKTTEEIAREMQANSRVNLYGIRFSPDNQAIQDKDSPILDELLKYLKQNGGPAVIIESHKDTPNGNAQSDLETTTARARAVVAWLIAHGISPARLQPKPLGRAQPLTENDTPQEIARNERIVLAKVNR